MRPDVKFDAQIALHEQITHIWHLARFPPTWNHVGEKESRQMIMLEQILIAKVFNFFGICSKSL